MEHLESVRGKTQTYKFIKHGYVSTSPRKSANNLSCLYVGKNFQYIEELISGFESSYCFDSFNTALKGLSKLSRTDIYPDVVLFDGNLPTGEMHFFVAAIRNDASLSTIPVIAEVTGCQPHQINALKHSKHIDDLIVLDGKSDALYQKVTFFKHVRAEQDTKDLQNKLETGFETKRIWQSFTKRLFDLVVSGILLILLAPIFLLIALIVKLESKGPIFYVSPRAGRGYRIFNFIKFRTMVVDADKKVADMMSMNQYNVSGNQPVFFKVTNDPRITRIGAFLRNTSLDELPQLVNVFLGDMSLVGNRPLPLYEASTLTTDDFAPRFMAPAGITGLWQIKKRGVSNITVEERIGLDIDYANKHSFVYDLWIIANTPTALLQKENV
jgi:lipopolysaccharide/colanic/teichoic acid biosynthesis glycosyltransferase